MGQRVPNVGPHSLSMYVWSTVIIIHHFLIGKCIMYVIYVMHSLSLSLSLSPPHVILLTPAPIFHYCFFTHALVTWPISSSLSCPTRAYLLASFKYRRRFASASTFISSYFLFYKMIQRYKDWFIKCYQSTYLKYS